MMLQLVLAYVFAAGTSITLVYLARRNRKQGWQRPARGWIGVELERREAEMPAAFGTKLDSGELMPQLLQLNRELAAHGSPVQPEIGAQEEESAETMEHALIRRA